MSEVHEEAFWGKEVKAFKEFLTIKPNLNYRDWQPTKWQSLQAICNTLVHNFGENGTALELGCGSATLLLQLAVAKWHCIGIDISPSALELASIAAQSLGVSTEQFKLVNCDFNKWDGPKADIVFSIGVLEHFDVEEQRQLLDFHCHNAQKAVLIGVPNLESPIFNSFIEWARQNNRLYEEEHLPISVRHLANDLGRKVLVEDGCHLFLSKCEYFIEGNQELDDFYTSLRARLVRSGGERFSSFPHMDFDANDIDVLSIVETETSQAERLRFGFLHYFLLDASKY